MTGWRIQKLEETTSTNDDAKRAAEAGEAEGFVVWALRQTAARGRQERKWESPQGNVACSMVLRPAGGAETYGCYSFVAALAVHDVVRARIADTSRKIRLKWPNDVLVNDRKISGILLEAGQGWLVAGIGLNVATHPQSAGYPATSLREEGAAPEPLENILNHLLERISAWSSTLSAQGFAPIRAAWLEQARRGVVTARLREETVIGEFLDLDPQGGLLLKLENGAERAISAGDVYFL